MDRKTLFLRSRCHGGTSNLFPLPRKGCFLEAPSALPWHKQVPGRSPISLHTGGSSHLCLPLAFLTVDFKGISNHWSCVLSLAGRATLRVHRAVVLRVEAPDARHTERAPGTSLHLSLLPDCGCDKSCLGCLNTSEN